MDSKVSVLPAGPPLPDPIRPRERYLTTLPVSITMGVLNLFAIVISKKKSKMWFRPYSRLTISSCRFESFLFPLDVVPWNMATLFFWLILKDFSSLIFSSIICLISSSGYDFIYSSE